MKIHEPGHIYAFANLDGDSETTENVIQFVNREKGHEHPGTQTQDVLRALIDRTMHCYNCLPWEDDEQIIHHMRMAIAYHEGRALIRKAEKGLYLPERVVVGTDGHFQLSFLPIDRNTDAERHYSVHGVHGER